jgi:hypothetical protein
MNTPISSISTILLATNLADVNTAAEREDLLMRRNFPFKNVDPDYLSALLDDCSFDFIIIPPPHASLSLSLSRYFLRNANRRLSRE